MKILTFSLASNIWVHSYPEALLAESLRNGGAEVVRVTCAGLIDEYCVAMDEANLPIPAPENRRRRVCASCAKRSQTINSEFGFRSVDISEFINDVDRQRVDILVGEAERDTWQNITIGDLPIGRFAAYELILKFKVANFELSDDQWGFYLGQLRSALRVHFAVERLLDEEMPDAALAYNSAYSVNRVFYANCVKAGISCYSVQAGTHPLNRLRTLSLFRDERAVFSGPRSDPWVATRAMPISQHDVASVFNGIRELFRARSAFVYSATHAQVRTSDTRESLGLRADRPTALIALSSRDELFAADVIGRFERPIDGTFIFPTQIDWVKHLISTAAHRPELQFIVRVHPREFPNKRESVMSPNVKLLRDALASLPDNVVVDWPVEERGFFDVLQVCDIVLSGWSSVGAESALFGLPVVIYDTGELLAYPSDLALVARAPGDYERLIGEALRRGVEVDQAVRAFRWYSFAQQRLAVDLSESIPPRAGWSARRVLEGMRSQKGYPVPLSVLAHLDRREIRQRATDLQCGPVVVDTVMQNRPSVAESTAWREREFATEAEERAAVTGCLWDMVELLGDQPDDPRSLSSRLTAALDAED